MKALHARLVKLGLDSRLRFVTQIIKAYGSKALPDAQKLFDECPNRDIILWNSFISLHARSDQPFQALNLFSLLHSQSFPLPNHFAVATAAHACAAASSIVFGQILHACIVKHGFLSNVVVGTALLDMYAKCYAIDFSKKMFDEMPEKNLVTWNALIFGNVLNGLPVPGLEFFYRMIFVEHIKPDEFSFATALSAYGSENNLPSGKQIHACVVSNGLGEDALRLYDEMKVNGVSPDEATYLEVLSACTHTGLITRSMQIFDALKRDRVIQPVLEHFTCMVDLLCRVG